MYNVFGGFMEYKEFAKYYDKFYSKKNYQKEVMFLKNFISKNDSIIDIGCGTGMHAYYLNDYNIDGLDLNEEIQVIVNNTKKTIEEINKNYEIIEIVSDKEETIINEKTEDTEINKKEIEEKNYEENNYIKNTYVENTKEKKLPKTGF